MAADTAYLWEPEGEGIRLLAYRGFDTLAVVPESIGGRPVRALAPYLFSAHKNYSDPDHLEAHWYSCFGEKLSEEEAMELPEVKGDALRELRLPSALRQVGAYALYNCGNLRRLEFYASTADWGTGVFTGCTAIEELSVHVDESGKSCLKEVLAELRQTLKVSCHGQEESRLIFPEFFEEAVENTPARILVTNTHGCGQKYRNCFVRTQLQFQEYDGLFPHVKVQEPEKLVADLALGRVMYPCCLSRRSREAYMEYLGDHRRAAACAAVEREDTESLLWLLDHLSYEAEDLKAVIDAAGRRGNPAAVSLLMDKTRTAGEERGTRRRRFAL